jgi:hypothetical protein
VLADRQSGRSCRAEVQRDQRRTSSSTSMSSCRGGWAGAGGCPIRCRGGPAGPSRGVGTSGLPRGRHGAVLSTRGGGKAPGPSGPGSKAGRWGGGSWAAGRAGGGTVWKAGPACCGGFGARWIRGPDPSVAGWNGARPPAGAACRMRRSASCAIRNSSQGHWVPAHSRHWPVESATWSAWIRQRRSGMRASISTIIMWGMTFRVRNGALLRIVLTGTEVVDAGFRPGGQYSWANVKRRSRQGRRANGFHSHECSLIITESG